MDELVKAALKKWPNVPHCHGWLALDARGEWYMRDDRTQAAGPFPQVKGSRILHDKLREFIHRNYGADEQGQWFFQNGPQRVYVELEAAPWIWRLEPSSDAAAPPQVLSHTGLATQVQQAVLDEQDRLFLVGELGVGLVHSLDMECAANAIEAGHWPLVNQRFEALRALHGFVLSPALASAKAEKSAPGPTRASP
jgi:hypothetical protein